MKIQLKTEIEPPKKIKTWEVQQKDQRKAPWIGWIKGERLSDLKHKLEEINHLIKQTDKQTPATELWNTIRRPNIQIIGIEGKETQFKGTGIILHNIIERNFSNLREQILIKG